MRMGARRIFFSRGSMVNRRAEAGVVLGEETASPLPSPHQLAGPGERCKLPEGRSPGANRVFKYNF